MSFALDRILKNSVFHATEELSLATINAIADANQSRLDYLLRLLTATPTGSDLQFLNPNADGPVITPSSSSDSPSNVFLRIGPPLSGKVIRRELSNTYPAPDVSASSPIWPANAVGFTQGDVPIIVKAQYFVGSDPVSAESAAVYRMPLKLLLIEAIRDAAAAQSGWFSKHLAMILTMWLSPEFQGIGGEQKREHVIAALKSRTQGASAALRGLGPLNSWSSPAMAGSPTPLPLIHPPLT